MRKVSCLLEVVVSARQSISLPWDRSNRLEVGREKGKWLRPLSRWLGTKPVGQLGRESSHNYRNQGLIAIGWWEVVSIGPF